MRSGRSTPGSRARACRPTELADGKQQLKGQIMLSLESPAARMGRLAGFILHDDHYRPLDEMLRGDRRGHRRTTSRRWPRSSSRRSGRPSYVWGRKQR